MIVNQSFARHQAGRFEPQTTEIVCERIKSGDTVLDVGAHFGYYTLLFSDLVGEEGSVIAFEPDHDVFKVLSANVRLNGLTNVQLFQQAASDTNGRARFYASDAGQSSLVPQRGLRRIYDVMTVRIDELGLERLDMAKIDTEGTEAKVLRGMRETIERCRPWLVLEFIPANAPVEGLLQELEDWNIHGLDHNILCWRTER